jgi:hypothetical protein
MNKSAMTRILILLILGLIISYVLITTIKAISETNAAMGESLPSTFILPSEDSFFINDFNKEKIKLIIIHNSKVRGEVAVFNVSGNYQMFMTKVNLSNSFSIAQIFHLQTRSSPIPTTDAYNVYTENPTFEFRYKTGLQKPISEVYFSFKGDSVRENEKSDSIISYSLWCRSLSLRYEQKSPFEIIVHSKWPAEGVSVPIPINFLFLKHKRQLYFFLLASKNKFIQPIPIDMLYNLITK